MRRNKIAGWLAGMMLVLVVIGLMAWGPPAQAQTSVGGITYGTFSGIGATCPASTSSNITTGPILVRQNRGLALIAGFTIATNSVGSITFKFDVSLDGTNYTTTKPLVWVVDGSLTNSSGAVLAYTNVPPTYLNNVRWIRPSLITNGATNALSAVALQYSYSNSSSP